MWVRHTLEAQIRLREEVIADGRGTILAYRQSF